MKHHDNLERRDSYLKRQADGHRRGSMGNPYRVYCKRVGPDGSLPPCHCKGDFCVASTNSGEAKS